ncbi:MAG: hypothetical protein RI564_11015 [Gracilimonas sp.]|jgi:hypothetical protein|nr:hypothetical protein [Gracilimonas sp.]
MLKSNYNLIHAKLIIVVSLFAFLGGCISIGEEGCTGRIQVNENLYNEIIIKVGETFKADLLGDPALFSHPNGYEIGITSIRGNLEIVDILLDPNVGEETIFITGKKEGSTEVTIHAEDECSGDRGRVTKTITITVNE